MADDTTIRFTPAEDDDTVRFTPVDSSPPADDSPVQFTAIDESTPDERAIIAEAIAARQQSRQEFAERTDRLKEPLINFTPRGVASVSPVLSLLPTEVGQGMAEGMANIASAATSPENIALGAAAIAAPEVVGPVLGGMMAKEAGRAFGEASVAIQTGDTREATRLLTEGGAATVGALTGAVAPALPRARAAASSAIKETPPVVVKEAAIEAATPEQLTLPLLAEATIDAKSPALIPPDAAAPKPLRPLGDPYSEPIVERVGRLGSGPVSTQVAKESLQIVDTAKRLVGELNATVLDDARRAAGSLNEGTTWMNDIKEVTPNAAVGNLHTALETRARTGNWEHVPETARELGEKLFNANLAIGKLAESAATPESGFVATGLAQRMLSAYGMDVIRRGGGPAWDAWAEGLAKANEMELPKVKAFLRRWKHELDAPGPDTAHLDKIAQDFKRKFPNVVTHIKVPRRGGWHEIVHSSPFRYLEEASNRTAHSAAFRQVYPPGSGLVESTRRAVMREMETDKHATEFDNLVRALQGHPIDSYSRWWNAPDTPIGASVRVFNDAMQPLFSLMLSATSFRNIGEIASGGAQIFMGYRRTLEAALKERRLYTEIEREGMVNRALLDFSYNPTAPVRSASRIASNTIRKVFAEQLANEFQEFTGAARARVVANEIREGRLPAKDRERIIATMRAMGITNDEAIAAVAGRNEAAVRQFETKAAEFLYGGNRAIAESSPLGANRAFTQLFKWHSYPMTKLRQVRSLMNNLIESVDKRDAPQIKANAELLARHVGGTALAGAFTTGIMALIYEGIYGLGIRANEAQNDFPGFLVDSYTMAMGGPVQIAAKLASEGGDASQWLSSLLNAAAPVSVANDLSRAVLGIGNYEGLDSFDRVGEFIKSKTPFSRAIKRGMAVFELSQDNADLDTAIRAFKRWRRDKFGSARFESHLVDDYDNAAFRATMKKAVSRLQEGDEEGYQTEIDRALNMENVTTRKVKASLRGRKIMQRPKGEKLTDEDMEELQRILGEKGINLLENFDAMLNTL